MPDSMHVIGLDLSTQAVTAALVEVRDSAGTPVDLGISRDCICSRPYPSDHDRRDPGAWVDIILECLSDLRAGAPQVVSSVSIGISTAFPGVFPVLANGSIDSSLVSLYDDTDDSGLSECSDDLIRRAECETLNRMQAGSAALGLTRLIKSDGLRLGECAAILPPATALVYSILLRAGLNPSPSALQSDFTQGVIGGLYHSRTAAPIPEGVADLLRCLAPGIDIALLANLLPPLAPSWTNALPADCVQPVRELLGLPELEAISLGAGDSAAGALALHDGPDTIINIRGSTDSPIFIVDSPADLHAPRENILHYPLPTVASLAGSPWCAVAPTLRSGKIWDWVKRLRFDASDPEADSQLEAMALDALNRRLNSPSGSPMREPLVFDTALGGERAPDWDPHATGRIEGLLESHTLGDIALAALEGLSHRLSSCIRLMEERYRVTPSKLILAGGPARSAFWNHVTQAITGKRAYATTFSDASVLGAALIANAALHHGKESDEATTRRLAALSRLSSTHPQVTPAEVRR